MVNKFNMVYQDKDGNVVKERTVTDNIFRSVNTKSNNKIKLWILKRIENHINRVIRIINWSTDTRSRYRRIHTYVKKILIYGGMRCADKIISRYMVKSMKDIPAEAYNNHVRIWYDSWNKGLDDTWETMLYQVVVNSYNKEGGAEAVQQFKLKYPTGKEYLEDNKHGKNVSYNVRKLMGDLYITEVLEDTFDRDMINCTMFRMVHSMMKHYGVSVEEMKKVPTKDTWRMFTSKTASNPEYFMYYGQKDAWYPDNEKEDKGDK